MPSLANVAAITPKRELHARARLTEHPSREWWLAYFRRLEASDYLTLRKPRPAGKYARWRPDFDWALNTDNLVKVLEGKFDNDAPDRDPGHWYEACQHEPRCERLTDHQLREARERKTA